MTGSDVRRVVRSGRPGVPVRDRIRSAICEYIMKGKALHGQTSKGKHGTCAVNQVKVVYWVCRNHGGYTSSGCRMWYLLARDGPQAPQPFRRVARRSRARKVVQRTTLIMPVEVLMIYK